MREQFDSHLNFEEFDVARPPLRWKMKFAG